MFLISNAVRKIRNTVRYKLLVLVLFPILLVMPIALVLAIYWGANFSYEQLYIKVNTDLSVSHDVFDRLKRDYLNSLSKTAESYKFRSQLSRDNSTSQQDQIEQLKRENSFSYIHLLDKYGQVNNHNRDEATRQPRQSKALDQAKLGQSSSGIEIFSAEELSVEGLADQVVLPLIETARARSTERTVENRGMMIRALYPIVGESGDVQAIIDAGVLLNGNFTFVDVIRDLVYGPGSLIEGSIGTVTVFLDDVRITTNVPIRPGERALGTRVSNEVRSNVLDQGNKWVARAFVVNDWYISSYEPIVDNEGKRVGMLYAGFLEKPFRQSLINALIVLILLFLALMALSSLVAIKGAKSIFKPIELMGSVVSAIGAGKDQRTGKINSDDEIGSLAVEFDKMLDLLDERKILLQNWAVDLEGTVDKRTAELEHKNAELSNTISVLRKTRQKLVVAEKLAALGELTAGVAHEINNPTAVILGNLDVIIDEMGSQLKPVQNEIDLVISQIYRIKDITDNLLQYAKPGIYAGYITDVNVNTTIEETMKLLQHLRLVTNYQLELTLDATLSVNINEQELQQVLINLMSNAIQALPDSDGEITILTRDIGQNGVEIIIEDNGHGMDKEMVGRVFNPFYTTKGQGEGTGLGLSISFSLVNRYGGNIEVSSDPNVGTRFTVFLYCTPVMVEDEKMILKQLEEIEADTV